MLDNLAEKPLADRMTGGRVCGDTSHTA